MVVMRRSVLLWIVVLLTLAIAAYWLGPASAARARLELLALDADSRFGDEVWLSAAPDSAGLPAGRFPLILAVRNSGIRPSAPQSLALSVPGWIRLYAEDGAPLPFQDSGESLIQYRIPLAGEAIEPAALPHVPAGLDHLWITAELGSITCRLRWDGVPEFAPAPAYDPALLSTIEAFYSLDADDERYTGRLRIRLDAEHLQSEPAPFVTGDVTLASADVRLPRLSSIAFDGARSVVCGAPEQRVALESFVWRTGATGTGRWIQVVIGGRTRRMLYDTTGDGVIDLEVWDGQGNGRFEARRPVSYMTPPFLLPLPAPVTDTARPADNVAAPPQSAPPAPPDSTRAVRPDSAARDTTRQPGQPADSGRAAAPRRTPRDSTMLQALRQDSLRRDSLLRARARRDTLEHLRQQGAL